MENEITSNAAAPGCATSSCLLWFLGGISLSFTIVLSLVLLVLLTGSLALNAYLGWRLSNLQITVSQKPPEAPQVIVVTATPEIALQPTEAPPPQPSPSPLPLPTVTPVPPSAQVQTQMATVAAIATAAVEPAEEAAAFVPATATPASPAVPLDPAQQGNVTPAPQSEGVAPDGEPTADSAPPYLPPAGDQAEVDVAAYVSSNSYELIPISGGRESRPAAEHGDLNLKLRAPEPIDAEKKLVEIDGSGIDPNAPEFSKVFNPDIVETYAIHGWDWGKNDKSELITDGQAILVGLKTNPGDPIKIPPTETDIYSGKFFATVLYADEDKPHFCIRQPWQCG